MIYLLLITVIAYVGIVPLLASEGRTAVGEEETEIQFVQRTLNVDAVPSQVYHEYETRVRFGMGRLPVLATYDPYKTHCIVFENVSGYEAVPRIFIIDLQKNTLIYNKLWFKKIDSGLALSPNLSMFAYIYDKKLIVEKVEKNCIDYPQYDRGMLHGSYAKTIPLSTIPLQNCTCSTHTAVAFNKQNTCIILHHSQTSNVSAELYTIYPITQTT